MEGMLNRWQESNCYLADGGDWMEKTKLDEFRALSEYLVALAKAKENGVVTHRETLKTIERIEALLNAEKIN